MPVPSTLASLSTTPGSNPPGGGENPFPELDDHLRQSYAFHAQNRDAIAAKLNSSAVSAYMLTVLDDANAGAARATLGAVGNTGNETIAGVKTFSAAPVSSAAASAANELMRKGEVDSAVAAAVAGRAAVAGDASQVFSVAAATDPAHALRLGQFAASAGSGALTLDFPCSGLPGGATKIVVQAGFLASRPSVISTHSFNEPFANECVGVWLTERHSAQHNDNPKLASAPTTTQFQIHSDAPSYPIYWVAIGY